MYLHPLCIKAKIILPKEAVKGKSILIFCHGGIGNVTMMKPMIEAFCNVGEVMLAYDSFLIGELLDEILPEVKSLPMGVIIKGYDVAVCNFLNCKKEIVRKVIDLRVKTRICHSRGKFDPVFNVIVPFNNWDSEVKQNLALYDYYTAI
jgi:hypothetical protein